MLHAEAAGVVEMLGESDRVSICEAELGTGSDCDPG